MMEKARHIMRAALLALTFTAALSACDTPESDNSLDENETFVGKRLSAIAPDGHGGLWVGCDTGDLIWRGDGQTRTYPTGATRIYDALTDSISPNDTTIWIEARNMGLRRVTLRDGRAVKEQAYGVANIADRYSAYCIARVSGHIYTGTSEGLFRLDGNHMTGIYPNSRDKGKDSTPCVTHKIATLGHMLYAATQDGLVCHDTRDSSTRVVWQGTHIRYVAAYADTVYATAGQTLLTLDTKTGTTHKKPLGFTPKSIYRHDGTFYFICLDYVYISEDLKRFTCVHMRRRIPDACSNIIVPPYGRQYFSTMITEDAIWDIPAHLGAANGYSPVVAAAQSGQRMYYLNSKNRLFRQDGDNTTARQVYEFPQHENILSISADGDRLWIVNNQQEVKLLRLRGSLLENSLLSRTRKLYGSPSKITASTPFAYADTHGLYVGIQDCLMAVGENGNVRQVHALDNVYTSAFNRSPSSSFVWLSTLNQGTFYGHDSTFCRMGDSGETPYMRDATVVGTLNPKLVIADGHKVYSPQTGDTLDIKGVGRLVCTDDSTVFAIPEFGFVAIRLRNGHITNAGEYYPDIKFFPQATFASGRKLYLGSSLGVMACSTDNPQKAEWVRLERSVINLRNIVCALALALALAAIAVVIRTRHRHEKARTQRLRIGKLRERIGKLVDNKSLFDTQQQREIDDMRAKVDGIDTSRPVDEAMLATLFRMARNKEIDLGILLARHLQKQMQHIADTKAYEVSTLINESARTLESAQVDMVAKQVRKNGLWLRRMAQITTETARMAADIKGCAIIKGVDDGVAELANAVDEALPNKPIDIVETLFGQLQAAFRRAESDNATQLIKAFADERRKKLDDDGVSGAFRAKAMEMIGACNGSTAKARFDTLRALASLDAHIKQNETLALLRHDIERYEKEAAQVMAENDGRVNRKFGSRLEMEITARTTDTATTIERRITQFYALFAKTDDIVIHDILQFGNLANQQARVLVILMAKPKAKRTLIPGMLGMYGNLNPVISRLMNARIKPNIDRLRQYAECNPLSTAQYIVDLYQQ